MHVRGLSCAFDICFGPADCIHVILAEIWFDLEDIADELYHLLYDFGLLAHYNIRFFSMKACIS